MEIYCDMDGVLCDFERRFEEYTGSSPKGYKSKKGLQKFWNEVHKHGVDFWSGMEWQEGGKELWDYIEKYRPTILTTPSREIVSRIGKALWVSRNLQNYDRVLFTPKEGKSKYARQGRILIDDLGKNLKEWEEAGGCSIKCRNGNIDEVIKNLVKLGCN